MKKTCLSLSLFCSLTALYAEDGGKMNLKNDTLYTELKKEVVVLSSTKETNSLRALPAAVSVFSSRNLEALQVHSLKDLSAIVPNYFVADYGSKMTAPVYIRGIGARSGTQTVSMYVDNIPYFNLTSYDIELFDIQRVEVLRGTQGTLYGRNAMGGILNVYTLSPLKHQGSTVKVGAGSYGQLSVNASTYQPINDKMGISVSAFYNQHDGYFTNQYTGKKVDDSKNIGGRMKYVWNITPRLTANYSLGIDYTEQGAFPYADIKTGEVNYNSEGYYNRNLITNGLSFVYKGNGYDINSTTGYQYLNDDMNMDQDYTPLAMFQINQKQKQHSVSQEFTIKSASAHNYQWSNGLYGFYDHLNLTPPVSMMKDGIKYILQQQMDNIHAPITFTDNQIVFDGEYTRPTYGAAVFHQSTYNNLFVKGLSLTAGVRLDYEKTKLDYNAFTSANFTAPGGRPGTPAVPYRADTAIVGTASKDFLEVLPKVVLKYEFQPNTFIYASASRGYKSGGHNIQMFADLLEGALMTKMMGMGRPSATKNLSINDSITFKPEYSWNYEIGGQAEIIENMLTANFSAYYIDVDDVQITQFVKSGGGRKIINAGKADSKGFELGFKLRPCTGFFVYGNYGFSDARFKKYEIEGFNFTDNHIPFAPRSTYSLGANMTWNIKNSSLIDKVTVDGNFSGVDKIYWNEANTLSQGFYGTLDARIAFDKGIFTVECWGKNVLDRQYDAFLFESSHNYFSQKGKPARWGASLKIKL